jgi:hypothetical protein
VKVLMERKIGNKTYRLPVPLEFGANGGRLHRDWRVVKTEKGNRVVVR